MRVRGLRKEVPGTDCKDRKARSHVPQLTRMKHTYVFKCENSDAFEGIVAPKCGCMVCECKWLKALSEWEQARKPVTEELTLL